MAPRYDALCSDCDCEFEYIHAMKDSGVVPRCPECRSRNTEKIIVDVPMMKVRDASWEYENGGKGRRFDQLAKHAKDDSQDCHFRSLNDAKEAAKKRGFIISNE